MYQTRYQPFYTHCYSQIPYLDFEIRTIDNMRLGESQLRHNRYARTANGLAATTHKANVLDR